MNRASGLVGQTLLIDGSGLGVGIARVGIKRAPPAGPSYMDVWSPIPLSKSNNVLTLFLNG